MPASSAINRFVAIAAFAALPSATACHSQAAPTVATRPLDAAAPAPGDTIATHVYVLSQVDKKPKLLPGQQPVPYPAALQERGVQGAVIARFVLDENGRAVMATFKEVKSDDPLFTAAVRATLACYRFAPGTLRGKPVPVVVQMPFVFRVRRLAPSLPSARPPNLSRGPLPLSDIQRPAC